MSPGAYTSPSGNLSRFTRNLYVCVFAQSCPIFETAWTVASQAPLPMEFSQARIVEQVGIPSPGDLLHSGIEPASLASPALASGFFTSPGLKHCFLQVPFKGDFSFS